MHQKFSMLDIEEVYNHVSCGFLMANLEWNMGFPSKWRSWLSICFSAVWFLILIDGEATCFFSSVIGLCLGDQLSTLLLFVDGDGQNEAI